MRWKLLYDLKGEVSLSIKSFSKLLKEAQIEVHHRRDNDNTMIKLTF